MLKIRIISCYSAFSLTALLLFSNSVKCQLPPYSATLYDTAAINGYFLAAPQGNLMILDKFGEPVYYKSYPANALIYNFSLQKNGLMSFSDGHKFFLMDSTFRVVDSVECKNVFWGDGHEMQILPNGHYLLLGEDTFSMDLSSYSWKGKPGSKNALVGSAVIQEQDENKDIVFEWHAKDYFTFDDLDTFYLTSNHDTIDLTHTNSLESDNDGNILLCSFMLNEITKIKRSNGAIIWRFGGKQNQFAFTNCPIPFYCPHDIRRISNGNITLFDNGMNKVWHGGRAMEFKLDEKKKVATLKWSYIYNNSMVSAGRGNVQRLSNGNTLVNFGKLLHRLVSFVEVDSTGKKLFELKGPDFYRVFHYSSFPFHLNRPTITCFDSAGAKYLDAGAGHQTYKWSTGETSRIITVTKPGTYSLFVPYGEGGFISSEKMIVTDISIPCSIAHPSSKGDVKNKIKGKVVK